MASPGNLTEDRKKVFEIVNYLNLDRGQRDDFVAEVVTWETHTFPAVGDYAQSVINDQFPKDIDIFIGMMGTHFGTPTKNWGSGTEEEFRIAYQTWQKNNKPEIMFYFSNAMSSLGEIDPQQLSKRNSFQNELKDFGVYHFEYTDIVEFQFDLSRHISSTISKILDYKDLDNSEGVIPDESSRDLSNFHELIIKDPLVQSTSLLFYATERMNKYSDILVSMSKDIKKLEKNFNSNTRKLNKFHSTGNIKLLQKTIDSIVLEMRSYSKKIKLNIPSMSYEFSESIITILRVLDIIKINSIHDKLHIDDLASNIKPLRDGLILSVNGLFQFEKILDEFPEDITELNIQTKIILALHRDLISSLNKSIELLGRLEIEIAES